MVTESGVCEREGNLSRTKLVIINSYLIKCIFAQDNNVMHCGCKCLHISIGMSGHFRTAVPLCNNDTH